MNPAAEIGSLAGLSDPQLVGEGGFGRVYRCWETNLGRPVAVKIARRPIADANARRRFEDECRAAGALSAHPNVATVHRSGFTASGHPYLVMEYLPGGSLADRMATHGALGWEDALRVGVRTGEALHAAHAEGLLHRDLKPENILVSRFGEPLLADFGLAQTDDSATVDGGGLVTTLAHAAPELLGDDHESTTASDIYALASTVFTLIGGAPPFWREDEPTIYPMLARIATEDVPDLRPSGVPPMVCEILERSLSRNPDQRPSSARQFSSACREACSELGVDPDAQLTIDSAGDDDERATVVRPRPALPVRGDPAATTTFRGGVTAAPSLRGDSAPTIAVASERPLPDAAPPERGRRLMTWGAIGLAVVLALIVMTIAMWPGDRDQTQAQSPTTTASTSTTSVATTVSTAPLQPPTSDEPLGGTAAVQPPSPEELDDFPRIAQSARSAAPPVIDPVVGEAIPPVLKPVSSDEPDLVLGSDLTCLNDAGTAPVSCSLALGAGGWFAMATWGLSAEDDDCVFEGDPCPEITLYASTGRAGRFDPVARTDFAAFLPAYVMDILTVPFTSGGDEALAIHYVTGGASNSWSYLEVVTWADGNTPSLAAQATAETNGGVPDAHSDGILLEDFREQEVVDTYRTAEGAWMSVDL